MTVGLKKDQEIKTEKIVLYKYGKVYFPNNDYYNSDPLPIEWLELFEDHKVLQNMFDSNKELDELQEKLIKEQKENDPNHKALLSKFRRSSARIPSIDNESSTKPKKIASQESLAEMASYQSDEESKFMTNKNAFKSKADNNEFSNTELQNQLK